jgi:hypothetical protein
MLNKVKKLLAILSILIYTSTALGGIVVNFHYCKGRLAHISLLNFGGKAGCACNPENIPMDCCKDELLYERADDHRSVQGSYTFNAILFTPELPPADGLHNQFVQESTYAPGNFYKDVRRSCPEPIYLLNRVFRI